MPRFHRFLTGLVFLGVCLAVTAADIDRDKLQAQLIRHEKEMTKVYLDSMKIPTIGVGFNLKRGDAKKKIEALGLDYAKVLAGQQELTSAQVRTLLTADTDAAIADCKAVFPKFGELSDVRQRVLVDMMFNLGKTKFAEFKKMIAAVKDGKFPAAADEMKDSDWFKQVKSRGKTLEAMMRTDKE